LEGGGAVVMRFRNRFKCEHASVRACEDCGIRIATTLGDGRETRIHEFPLCEPFKVWMAAVGTLPDGKTHDLVAVVVDDAETLGNPELHEFDGDPQ
jgi:hypothetical protein